MVKQSLENSKNTEKLDDIKKGNKSKLKLAVIIVIVVLLLALLSVIGIVVYKNIYRKTVVMSYDGITFNRNDYMMYLRLAKTSLFDENTNELPKATLNTIVDKENNVNVETYLKNKVEQSLKISGAVQTIAKKEKIELKDEQKNKLQNDKDTYIESLGGRKEFLKFLKDNNTTEEAYDNMAYTDMLYTTIYTNLYSDSKVYDLTDKEKENAKKEYEQNYYKARQILFIFVDPTTKEKLPDSIVEQKKLLAQSVKDKINNEINFDEYIKKYSDDAVNAEPPFDMYFKSGEVLQEIEDTTKSLNIGEVSDVIKSNYAFHIIKRDALDSSYLNKIYEEKREEKFMKVVNEQINNSVIIIEDSFTNMKNKLIDVNVHLGGEKMEKEKGKKVRIITTIVIAVACIAVVILLWLYLRNLNKAVYDSAKAAANEIEVNSLKEVTDEEENKLNEEIEKIQNEISLLKTNVTATTAITMGEIKDSTADINGKIAELNSYITEYVAKEDNLNKKANEDTLLQKSKELDEKIDEVNEILATLIKDSKDEVIDSIEISKVEIIDSVNQNTNTVVDTAKDEINKNIEDAKDTINSNIDRTRNLLSLQMTLSTAAINANIDLSEASIKNAITSAKKDINSNTNTKIENAIDEINQNTNTVVEAAKKDINKATMTYVNSAKNDIKSTISNAEENILSNIDNSTNLINLKTMQYVNSAKNNINENIQAAQNDINKATMTYVNSAKNDIKSTISNAEENILSNIDNSTNLINLKTMQYVNSAKNNINENIQAAQNDINKATMTYVNSAKNNINTNISNLSNELALGYQDLDTKATANKTEIIGKINDISSKQDTYYNNLINKITGDNTNIFTRFDNVDSTLDTFKTTVNTNFETIKTAQNDMALKILYIGNSVGSATDGEDKWTLFGRITKVVNGIDTINAKLETLNTNVNTIDANIDSLIEALRTKGVID